MIESTGHVQTIEQRESPEPYPHLYEWRDGGVLLQIVFFDAMDESEIMERLRAHPGADWVLFHRKREKGT